MSKEKITITKKEKIVVEKDNLKKAQTALSISGVPRTEERLEMLNNLKKKF